MPDNFLTQEEIDALLGGGETGAASIPDKEDTALEHADTDADEKGEARNLDLILDFPLNLSVRLGEIVKNLEDVRRIVPGTVVELDRMVSDPVDVFINGKLIARGEVLVVEEFFGIRITQIFTPMERIKKLK